MMHSNEDDDDHYIAGAHGTIAEQKDEAFYDDRSDADDDMEKGRIHFPNKIYGRDHELEILLGIYERIVSAGNNRNEGRHGGDFGEDNVGFRKMNDVKKSSKGEQKIAAELESTSDAPTSQFKDSVVFLSGYSGVGKSAIVREFVNQIQSKYESVDSESSILYICGKYTEQSSATAPFSAISEVLEKLTRYLSRVGVDGNTELENKALNSTMRAKVWDSIKASELIQPGSNGSRILRETFPILAPLLDICNKDDIMSSLPTAGCSYSPVHPSMNAMKECTLELLSVVCKALEHPLILFLDGLQWGDEPSIEMLSCLLSSTELSNIMFICAYSSNEVDPDHSFAKLMERITNIRSNGTDESISRVKHMDLFSLSPEAIATFIADCVKKEEPGEVAELADVVYQKTMGNIFFVKQALEELVRKNVLFYDIMCFDWRWVVSKAELSNYLSDDVVDTVKGKIKELPADIQNLLVVMAYIPNTLDVSILKELMSNIAPTLDESKIRDRLKQASEEGMMMLSVESGNYVIAHDMIRQASLQFAAEKDQYDILLHISTVLIEHAQDLEREWCLFVAVDILNNLPSHKTGRNCLVKLNLRVSKIARNRGSPWKENDLLLKGLKCFESTGIMWKHYKLSLELHNAIIISEYSIGSFKPAKAAIDEVIKHAKTLNEKLTAYVYQVLCRCGETRDYSQGVEYGIRVLKLYGYEVPASPTKTRMMKEEIKLKIALRNRSYSCLANLPVREAPILFLISNVMRYALFASKDEILRILAWRAIQCALKHGMDKHFPRIMAYFGGSLAKEGKVKTAYEVGNVALALSEEFHDDKENYAMTQMIAYTTTVSQMQSFRSTVESLNKCYKDLRLVGNVEMALGSFLCYSQVYGAIGLELGQLWESRLCLVEEYCRDADRTSFLVTFQICRQFSLNLRKKMGKPTVFQGPAFHEEEILCTMNDPGRYMVLRDSSSHRLQLAFIFWDEDTMADMLNILSSYPLTDHVVARLHNRLCFTGLAAFALGRSRSSGPFQKLGQKCLRYFRCLAKNGPINARPVYLFMLALKSPSRKTFKKAIAACIESHFIHLQAVAIERYAAFLNAANDDELANDCLVSAYWLYQDWGAHAKAFELLEENSFLKNCKRSAKIFPLSSTVSLRSESAQN